MRCSYYPQSLVQVRGAIQEIEVWGCFCPHEFVFVLCWGCFEFRSVCRSVGLFGDLGLSGCDRSDRCVAPA
jgi:hypothetical protein